jgi:hypothetical protein
LCLWAQDNGRTLITAETTRDTEALHRRWGFKEYVKIVSFELSDNFEEALIKTHKELIKGKESSIDTPEEEEIEVIENDSSAKELSLDKE